ncbi:MAG: hypothetical protein ACE5HQ_06035 [Gemmatimonadota bacterium]
MLRDQDAPAQRHHIGLDRRMTDRFSIHLNGHGGSDSTSTSLAWKKIIRSSPAYCCRATFHSMRANSGRLRGA